MYTESTGELLFCARKLAFIIAEVLYFSCLKYRVSFIRGSTEVHARESRYIYYQEHILLILPRAYYFSLLDLYTLAVS